MMRYVVRAAKPVYIETPLWDDVEPQRLSFTVDDAKETDTGLIDAKGNPIFRLQDPIGFGKR
jgi:hypothetical protein